MCGEIALYVDRNRWGRRHICRNIELLGFDLHKAESVPAALEMVHRFIYRLVLVDFDTGGKETLSLCSFTRAGSKNTVLIVLTSKLNARIEEQLFDHGVNDVVVRKETSPRLLTKRIRAHLRSSGAVFEGRTVRLQSTVIDFDRREVWRNGTIHHLPGLLADLLNYFVSNPNRIISREELQSSPIWADSICSSAREGGKTFDVNIGKLRKIIEPDPKRPQIITSVRGAGWKLTRDRVC